MLQLSESGLKITIDLFAHILDVIEVKLLKFISANLVIIEK